MHSKSQWKSFWILWSPWHLHHHPTYTHATSFLFLASGSSADKNNSIFSASSQNHRKPVTLGLMKCGLFFSLWRWRTGQRVSLTLVPYSGRKIRGLFKKWLFENHRDSWNYNKGSCLNSHLLQNSSKVTDYKLHKLFSLYFWITWNVKF